ncbi:probable glutamate receptor [Centruroides sculpturatus]|uniref:probable glutamate receptor n=1 Tax=Centruroides sculpturatus TaxID=218467 RepID=UPI000C6D2F82|nr:probable glutamate receptor [Centruroides sculpturatus]
MEIFFVLEGAEIGSNDLDRVRDVDSDRVAPRNVLAVNTRINLSDSGHQHYILKIAAIKYENVVILDKSENHILGGWECHVFKAMQQKLRFSYSIVKPIDKSPGNRLKNGSWDGFIKKLVNQKADMTCFSLNVNSERFSVIDFSSPVILQTINFVTRSPRKTPNWSSIIKPFNKEVWIILLLILVMMGFVLHKVIEKDLRADKMKVNWTRRQVFWNLFCTLIYQGIPLHLLRRFPSRFLIGIWLLLTLVLISSYIGTLMSFMCSPLIEDVPRNFNELALAINKGDYNCGILGKYNLWQIMQNSSSNSYKIMKNNIEKHDNFMPGSRAMQRVIDENFAFIGSITMIKKLIRTEEMHKYRISDDPLMTSTKAFAMRKNFPLKKDINAIVIRLFEAGIVEKVDNSETKSFVEFSEFQPVSLEDLSIRVPVTIMGFEDVNVFRKTKKTKKRHVCHAYLKETEEDEKRLMSMIQMRSSYKTQAHDFLLPHISSCC